MAKGAPGFGGRGKIFLPDLTMLRLVLGRPRCQQRDGSTNVSEMLSDLKGEERLLLLKFVCSFAWADLEVKASEKKLVRRLVAKLGLSADESKQVESWLEMPPKAEEVDPNRVPREHRKLFLDAARQMVMVDGELEENERENLELFEMLLA